jgi:nucleoid-associated protein YgaU
MAFDAQLNASASASAGASLSPSGAAGSGLRRAQLVCKEPHGEVPFHLNPTQLVITKAVVVAHPRQRAAAKGAKVEVLNTHTRQLTTTMILDHWTSKRDVAQDVATVQGWLNPTSASLQRGAPEPAAVELDWNGPSAFEGYLTVATATYVLFEPSGAPLRASVAITIQEMSDEPPPQNPTSGGEPGTRTRLLRAGETLQSVAFAEYRDATLWRGLALANGIDDPLRLRAGTRLSVPPVARARELHR